MVLEPSWDVQRQEWFHNMDIVRPEQTDQRPVQQWNKHCVGCHVSRQQNEYRPATGEYATEWVDFGTSCERCHGPGSAHVEQYTRAAGRATVANVRIVRPTRLDPKTSSMICAQCHTLRNVSTPTSRPARTTTTISCRGSSSIRVLAWTRPIGPTAPPSTGSAERGLLRYRVQIRDTELLAWSVGGIR